MFMISEFLFKIGSSFTPSHVPESNIDEIIKTNMNIASVQSTKYIVTISAEHKPLTIPQ